MSSLPYDYDYAVKIAKQVFANTPGMKGSPEDLATHIMNAGVVVHYWDHKERRKDLRIENLFAWRDSLQGDHFWSYIYGSRAVPVV